MDKIKRITPEKAAEIIECGEPRGLFFCKETESRYIGIDNTTGEVWMEEFRTFAECKSWLNAKAYRLNRKNRIIRKIQKVSGNIAVILFYAGVIMLIGLLFCAPSIERITYYLLLTIAVCLVTTALFIYIIVYGEIKEIRSIRYGTCKNKQS